ncbi:hypothetical protein [Nonomuraea dietziae]|uniref:hypothetical protein n=1 Tax=Nonomuraea dietziae TaxID=65515 RepID=UPI0033E1B9B3
MPDCLTSFSVTANIEGPAEVRLGRPANPGEKYGYPAQASWPGEALAGIELKGRTAGEAERVVHEHRLKVSYARTPGRPRQPEPSTQLTSRRADHAVSCQRPRQHGDGPVSERSAIVNAMNGSATAASRLG